MPLIPISWLSQHVVVPSDLTPAQLAQDLVKVGLEEEAIHQADVTGPVVVGLVLSREAKEQSNGKVINYCRVDVGSHNDAPGTGKEASDVASRGIICGAHNFDVGDYVVVALPGAVLPGGFEIAARKTYGHTSDGMICSSRELGIGQDHDGIIVLANESDAAAKAGIPGVGADVLGHLGIAGETLEINITPDRGYCFSMRGVAREYHHSTGAAFTDPALNAAVPAATPSAFDVKIEDNAPIYGKPGCDRFVTRIVRGVDPNATSPKWLQERLSQAGMRPISLAVDATNYVMLDLGQPLHAYDLDKVAAPIVVRRAHPGEHLTTLDEIDRELSPEDLLICDSASGHGSRVLGLAGTMGGFDTEITAETENVLIEAAHFDAVSVARQARRHKLPSEAAKRFEREVDPLIAPAAAQAVVDLLVEYGGGVAGPEVGDFTAISLPEPQEFPISEVARLTGLDVPQEQIIAILEDIGVSVSGSGPILQLTAPTWRPDLSGPAHFVEEIARLVGYDNIPVVTPRAVAGRGLTTNQREARNVYRGLAEAGWTQVNSYPFVSKNAFDKQGIDSDDSRRTAIRLANPLQDDAPYLRTSILDSLLDVARMNVARANVPVAIFESSMLSQPAGLSAASAPAVGQRPSDNEINELMGTIPAQPLHVAGVAVGPTTVPTFGFESAEWDWKGAIEAALSIGSTVGLKLKVKKAVYPPFHPGRCAQIMAGKIIVGYAGELSPTVCRSCELPKRAVAFELNLDAVLAARGDEPIAVDPVLTSPVAKEDLAFVVAESVTVAQLENAIRQAVGGNLESLTLFDVYQGEQVPEGKKSLAFSLRLRSDHTLTAEETAAIRNKILKITGKNLGAELR